MKKKVLWICLIVFFVVFGVLATVILLMNDDDKTKNSNDSPTDTLTEPPVVSRKDFGVWWWSDELESEKYLEFAEENGITEIYYCDSTMNSETTEFIKQAKLRDIKVYLLAGEKEWLNDKTNLESLISRYVIFQSLNAENCFSGIHLDIEPHQFDDFSEKREEYILKLISLVNYLETYYSEISFDYDIPFWFDDEVLFNGTTKPAYEHIIDNADRVFVMSYRDTTEKIYDVGKDELDYAISVGKKLFLSVETYSAEGDQVSFFEEGKDVMNQEILKLREKLQDGYGISVHHIKTWYDLKIS